MPLTSEKIKTAKDSNRDVDINGWIEVKNNPITKAGVFPYAGWQIDDSLEPDKIYQVYRPAEELNNPETLESFKLIPIVNEHQMLGEGMTPAEEKGIEGTTGQDVVFEDGYIKANLKIFAESFKKLLDSGKKELSIGYRCLYDLVSGVYNGVKFDAVQRNIRGNHLALVDEGRAGPDVSVLDSLKITFDTMEFNKMNPNETNKTEAKDEVTLESLAAEVKKLSEALAKMSAGDKEPEEKAKDEDPEKEKAKDADLKAEKSEDEDGEGEGEKQYDNEDPVIDEETKKKDGEGKAMDAKIVKLSKEVENLKKGGIKTLLTEISSRDSLAKEVSNYIGVFDHATKTLQEVVKYAVDKLGLKCRPGQEQSVLEGYLAGKKAGASNFAVGKDSAQDSYVGKGDAVNKYLNGGK